MTALTCPACGAAETLVRHCTSPTCDRWECEACGAFGSGERWVKP